MLIPTLINRLRAHKHQRRATIELSGLSERQLERLGLSRLDILEAMGRR